MPWSIGGLQVEIDEFRGDQQFLQDIADNNTLVTCTITYASGVTYNGQGTVTDELSFSSQTSTASVSMMGQGRLTQQ